MRRGRFWTVVALAASVATMLLFWLFAGGDERREYATVPVERGPIVATVTATGTVNPVRSVTVGTYVSGPIQEIFVDYNSPVRRGQRIARIDPRTFQGKVDRARAELANADAQVAKARADLSLKRAQLQRQEALARTRVVSREELDVARSNAAQAEAQVQLALAAVEQAKAALAEAEVNLGYTDIVSPVDGIVVSRDVQEGQTVAASFQTPTLFVIAEDLAKMQVNAFVSEADIGEVRDGQRATFTVDAYPGRSFPAVVRQVRNAPQSLENVVTYDVVLEVDNRDLLLKPGMTANVGIVTASADDVLKVPSAALRFRPPVAEDDLPAGGSLAVAGTQPRGDTGAQRDASTVYVLSRGEPKRVEVQTGLSDDVMTAVASPDLAPGDRVITRVKAESDEAQGWSIFPRRRGRR